MVGVTALHHVHHLTTNRMHLILSRELFCACHAMNRKRLSAYLFPPVKVSWAHLIHLWTFSRFHIPSPFIYHTVSLSFVGDSFPVIIASLLSFTNYEEWYKAPLTLAVPFPSRNLSNYRKEQEPNVTDMHLRHILRDNFLFFPYSGHLVKAVQSGLWVSEYCGI